MAKDNENKVGRPSKYGTINLKQVEKLASLGLTDKEIASILDISEATLNTYKQKPEFLESLKRGKIKADTEAIKSLYKRVIGYKYKEVTKEPVIVKELGKDVLVDPKLRITKVVTKEVVPDTTAQIFWLKNRRPQDWRDKQEVEVSEGVKIIKDGI